VSAARIGVLGGGAFGTALAIALAARGPVTLWARDKGAAASMAAGGENPRLPGIALPQGLRVTADLDAALAGRPVAVLLALPMQALRGFLAAEGARLDGRALVACCKGIDLDSLQGPSALIAAACPAATPAVLTGPSFAADIARGLPSALTLACDDGAAGIRLQEALAGPTLRLYRTTDAVGAELGGALKNVTAIAAGIALGAGLGESARAAVITRGHAETTRLAARLGARPETLAGLSGLGDLVLTATSARSRNYAHGLALGRGTAPPAGVTLEGVATARAAARLADGLGVALPMAGTVAQVCDGSLSVAQATLQLFNRPLKEE
jgi:glycerol-3-phosphate dehydrogenase (NAD(P)+)